MARKFYWLCFFYIFFSDLSAQSVAFFKEELTFKIEGDQFFVNGIYYFKCPRKSDSSLALYYPFPVDSSYSEADSLYFFNITSEEEITDYKKTQNGVLFYTGFDRITAVLVSYRQQFRSDHIRYILTTTQYWKRPLEVANYTLIVKSTTRIKSFSYPPDSSSKFGDTIVYYWKKKNFMPLEDMIFVLY